MGHLFITVPKNRTQTVRRMSGELVQKPVPKSVSFTELSSVNGTERATAQLASCRPFTADARDKFFVNVSRTFVGWESQSNNLIRGLRFHPVFAILLKPLSESIKDYRKEVQLPAVRSLWCPERPDVFKTIFPTCIFMLVERRYVSIRWQTVWDLWWMK
jgi:hypothetical protein